MSISIGRRMDETSPALPGVSPTASAAAGTSESGSPQSGAATAMASGGDTTASSATGVAGSPSGTPGSSASAGSAGSASTMATGSAGSASTMATGSAGSASSSTSSSSSGTGSTSGTDVTGTDTFLKLLVAQMRNQDPSQPMDDQSFVTELAQFNSVEQLLSLKQTIATQTTALQEMQGITLLGRTVTYAVPGVGSAPSTTSQGVVTSVSIANGTVQLQLGTQQVGLDSVVSVS